MFHFLFKSFNAIIGNEQKIIHNEIYRIIESEHLTLNADIDVAQEDYGFSYTSIQTDSVSACAFVLIDGYIKQSPFCYLSHSSKIPESQRISLQEILAASIQRLTKRLIKYFGIEPLSEEIKAINKLRLFVGGCAVGEDDRIIKSFSLLNNKFNIDEMKKLIKNTDVIHICEQLLGSVIRTEPVTFVMSPEDEAKGKKNYIIIC